MRVGCKNFLGIQASVKFPDVDFHMGMLLGFCLQYPSMSVAIFQVDGGCIV